jgi:hypothetical protein
MPRRSWSTELGTSQRAAVLWLGAALLLVFPLGVPTAVARPVDKDRGADICEASSECAAHSEKARSLYSSKKYEEALHEFQAAYDTRAEPLLLINLGRCYYRMGQAHAALTYYRRFQMLVPAPEAKVRDSLERYIAEARLEDLLDRDRGGGGRGDRSRRRPGRGAEQPRPARLYRLHVEVRRWARSATYAPGPVRRTRFPPGQKGRCSQGRS